MTDNERHERMDVLRNRCGTCAHLGSPSRWQEGRGITARCCYQSKMFDLTWGDCCNVASIKDWENVHPHQGWWETFANPVRCTRSSETPCPDYQRGFDL